MWLVVGFVGCEIHRGNGVSETEVRDVGPFSGVVAAYSIPVRVEEGEPRSVSVTCDANLLADLRTEVRGGDLIVRGRQDGARWVQIDPTVPCRVEVVGPGLVYVASTGSGRLTVRGASGLREVHDSGSGGVDVDGEIAAPALEVGCSGSGDVSIRSVVADDVALTASGSGGIAVEGGQTDRLDVRVTGSGPVWARRLSAVHVDAALTGSGGGEVTATGSLDATLSGSGDLRVWGDPDVRDVNETGSGRVDFAE